MREHRKSTVWLGLMGLALCFLLALPGMGEAAGRATHLTILHTNDTHGTILADDKTAIGIAEMAAYVKAIKKEQPDTLWLDAGDTFHGMPIVNVNRGENLVPLLNIATLDGIAPGNHDFNFGFSQLEKLSKEAKFPFLAANVVWKKDGKSALAPYKIYHLPGKLKVGVFGMTTPETSYKTASKNITEIDFRDPVLTAREMIRTLRPQCDILIAVMHMGISPDAEFTSERIAREAPGIDLIVDGHSHTPLPQGMTVGETLIVQAGSHGHEIGRVDFRLQDHRITGREARLLDKKELLAVAPKPDPEIAAAVKAAREQTEALFRRVILHTDRALSGESDLLRRQEAPLGNLCADAFRWRAGSDIAVVNGGAIRAHLPQGNVTWGDIIEIFPFGNALTVVKIPGSTVKEMLEHSVYAYPMIFNGFLHVSGMTFRYDPALPIGQRVKDIFIQGHPLEPDRSYTMAISDFLLTGGDDYDVLEGLPIVGVYGTCEEALADYLKFNGLKNIEAGRVQLIKEVPISQEEEKKAA